MLCDKKSFGLSCKILHHYHNYHHRKIPLPPSDEKIHIMSSPSITSSSLSAFIPPLPDNDNDDHDNDKDEDSDDRQQNHLNLRNDHHRNNTNNNGNSHHDDDTTDDNDDDDVKRTMLAIASDIIIALRQQPIYIIQIMMMIMTKKQSKMMMMMSMINNNDNNNDNNDDNDIIQRNISSNIMIEIAFITIHRILHPISTDPSLTTSLLIETIHQQYNEIQSIYSIFNASDSCFLASRALLIWDPKVCIT